MSNNSGWLAKTALLVGLAAGVVTVLAYLGIHYVQPDPPPPGAVGSDSLPPLSETSTLPSPPESTRAAYITAADGVCLRWFQETGRLAAMQPNASSPEDMDRQLLIISSMLNEWQAITPPAVDRAEVDGIIKDRWQEYRLLEEARYAYAAGDYFRGLELINESEQDDAAQEERALNYGFRVCR